MDDPRWEPGMPVLDRQAVREPAVAPAAPDTATTPVNPGDPGTRTIQQPQPRPQPYLPPSLQGLPPRSVPETDPTPLQQQYINLSVIALIAGVIAITALELGTALGSPLIKLCVIVGAPILALTTGDATLRIWRSAWAWMPVDRGKGTFRLAWVAVSVILLGVLGLVTVVVLTA